MKTIILLLSALVMTSCSTLFQPKLSDDTTPNGDFLACLLDSQVRVFNMVRVEDIASSNVVFIGGKMQIEEDMTYSFTFVINEAGEVYLLNVSDFDEHETLFDGEQLIKDKRVIDFVKEMDKTLYPMNKTEFLEQD